MFTVAKLDEDQRLVFGYASVAVRMDGALLVDTHGDVIDPADLEPCAYDFVQQFGTANVSHAGPEVGRVVESVYLSPEKVRAMFANGRGGLTISAPALAEVVKAMGGRWWIGFRVDAATFARVKAGDLRMFSIEGIGSREGD